MDMAGFRCRLPMNALSSSGLLTVFPSNKLRFWGSVVCLGGLNLISGGLQGQTSVPFPEPLEWAAPAGLPAAPGDAYPVIFAGEVPSPQAPVISEWNRTVLPGESFTLTGVRFTLREDQLAGSDTRVLLYAVGPDGGALHELDIWEVTSDLIMASVPANVQRGVYLVWVENAQGVSSPVILNRAQPEWVGPLGRRAAALSTKRVFGKNLSYQNGETSSHVYIRPSGTTTTPVAATVTNVEPFAITFTVPALSPGLYDIYVHNGHGGDLGWGEPLVLEVIQPWQRGSDEIALIDNSVADRTADLQAAVNILGALPTGGTLRLGPGTFRVSSELIIRGKVRIVGAGKAETTLLGTGGRVSLSSTSGNNITLEDFTFRAAPSTEFEIRSASFSGGPYNQDLAIRNVDFLVSSDTTSSIRLAIQAERFELTGAVMQGTLSGAVVDWWIHHNQLFGGRGEADGAIQWRSDRSVFHGRAVLEHCLAETADWPVGPNGNRNYSEFLASGEWAQRIWCSRLLHTAPNRGSIEHSYIAHNVTKDVAINVNKGEIILFHSAQSGKFAQVASNSGRTLTIRTDGTIDGAPDFELRKAPDEVFLPFQSVPNAIGFGTSLNQVAYVVLADGRGRGQIRRIVSHSATSITVESDWRVPPDATTKFYLSHIYKGHLQYKNDLSGVPVGWRDTGHIASYGINYDGNTFFSAADSNVNRRTFYSDTIQGYLTAPSYWNEMRNSQSFEPYRSGIRVNLRGGDWNSGATSVRTLGPLALGNWIRGGLSEGSIGSEAIVGGWGSLPANKDFIVGSGIENHTFRGTLLADSYSRVLFRNNSSTTASTSRVALENYSTPILIQNQTSGFTGPAPLNGYAQLPLAPKRVVAYDLSNMNQTYTLPIANGGRLSMNWSVQASDPWLLAAVQAGTGTVPSQGLNGRLNITVNPQMLPSGFSEGFITILSGGNATATIGVEVTNGIVPENPMLVYEPFNYGAAPVTLSKTTATLNLGRGLQGSWKLPSGSNSNNRGSYVPQGLTFGELITSGGALRAEGQWSGSSTISRQSAVSHRGTIWGSYLVSPGQPTSTSNPNTDIAGLSVGADGTSDFAADIAVNAKAWNANPAVGGIKASRNSSVPTNSGAAMVFSNTSPQTYLVLFKVTNVGLGTGKTARCWVLTEAQLAYWKPTDSTPLEEAQLDAAALGTAANQILQRGSFSGSGSADLDFTKYFKFASTKSPSSTLWNVVFDELRISKSRLNDVVPVNPTLRTLESWRTSRFSAASLLDPAQEATVWGDLADTDADGLNTLLEYFFDTHPLVADAPRLGVSFDPSEQSFVLEYTRALLTPSVSLEYIGGPDLTAPVKILDGVESITTEGPLEHVRYTLSPVPSERFFLRIGLTRK